LSGQVARVRWVELFADLEAQHTRFVNVGRT
jgi:hypothetical protein